MKKFIMSVFKDNNNVNEKNVIGVFSFVIMTTFAVVDVITGTLGKGLIINEFIYNSFVILVLGAFGISGVEKIFSNKATKKDDTEL